jgi:glucose/mannose-6-phosphate isomerase
MEFTKEVVSEYASEVVEIYSKGDYDLVRSLYLIHITDWVSYYLAEIKGVDAVEVNVITKLKNKLAENPF